MRLYTEDERALWRSVVIAAWGDAEGPCEMADRTVQAYRKRVITEHESHADFMEAVGAPSPPRDPPPSHGPVPSPGVECDRCGGTSIEPGCEPTDWATCLKCGVPPGGYG